MVPLVSPATVAVSVEPLTEADLSPGLAATVYPVTGLPPSDAGAVHVTMACVLLAVAITLEGAPGILMGDTAFDDSDVFENPRAVDVLTVNV